MSRHMKIYRRVAIASAIVVLTVVAIGAPGGRAGQRIGMGREGSRELPRWTRGVVDNLAECSA